MNFFVAMPFSFKLLIKKKRLKGLSKFGKRELDKGKKIKIKLQENNDEIRVPRCTFCVAPFFSFYTQDRQLFLDSILKFVNFFFRLEK